MTSTEHAYPYEDEFVEVGDKKADGVTWRDYLAFYDDHEGAWMDKNLSEVPSPTHWRRI